MWRSTPLKKETAVHAAEKNKWNTISFQVRKRGGKTTMITRHLIMFTAFFIISSCAVMDIQTHRHTGAISGRISPPNTLVQVIVTKPRSNYNDRKNIVAEAMSTNAGKYLVSNLEPGKYSPFMIKRNNFNKDDYFPKWYEIEVKQGKTTSDIDYQFTHTIFSMNYAPGHLFVGFNSDITDEQARKIIATVNCAIMRPMSLTNGALSYMVSLPYNRTDLDISKELLTKQGVKYVERDMILNVKK